MSNLVYDIECNGFLKDLTTIHCIVTYDIDTHDLNAYYEDSDDIYQGLLSLYHADRIIGHNIIGYDIPAIQKLYPKWTYKALDDTFILSCILDPLRSSHSIESYSSGLKVANEDWSCLTMNMLDRCVIDTLITAKIYNKFLLEMKNDDWTSAIQLEYNVALNHNRQLKAGVDIDIDAAYKTIECLDAELEGLRECINYKLPYRCKESKHQLKKFFKKNGDLQQYVKEYFKPEEVRSVHVSTD